jgi:histidinol-phosphatase (PHP family)
MGGRKITVGADAHAPAGVAAGFDTAAAILTEAGFDTYYTFEHRQAIPHRIL